MEMMLVLFIIALILGGGVPVGAVLARDPVAQALVAVEVPAAIFSNTSATAPFKAGKIRVLAVLDKQRSKQMPNVPTVKEATDGQITNLDTGSWFGLFAPAGTPQAIVDQLQKDVAAVVAKPQVRKTMEERGFIPVASTAAQFADIIKSDTAAWQKVIKEANIKPE